MTKRGAFEELFYLKEKIKKWEEQFNSKDDEERSSTSMVEEYLDEELLEEEEEVKQEIKNEPEEIVLSDDENIDDEIIKLLGEDQPTGPPTGPPVLEEISNRWSNILTSGTKLEDIIKKYPPPQNIPLLAAPTLNKEITAAVSEAVVMRDKKIAERQNQLGAAASALASTITYQIKNKGDKELIQTLSDVGRILTDIYFRNSEIRRSLIIPLLDKGMRDLMKEIKIDEFLFGKNLGEKIKEKKNIERSVQNIKPVNTKPKPSRGPSQSFPKNSFKRQTTQNTGQSKYRASLHSQGPSRKQTGYTSPQVFNRKTPVQHSRTQYSSKRK